MWNWHTEMCLRIVYLLSLGSWIVLLDYEMLYPWLYWDNQGKVLTNRKFLLETLLDLECSWHSFIWIKPNWNAELSFNPHACLTIACFISNSWHQRIFWILKIIISHFRMDFLNNWNFKWLLGPLKIETINQIFEIE